MTSCIFCQYFPDNNSNNTKNKTIIRHIESNITFTLDDDKDEQMANLYHTILIGILLNNVESDIYNILCDKCEHKLEYLSKCDICDIPL